MRAKLPSRIQVLERTAVIAKAQTSPLIYFFNPDRTLASIGRFESGNFVQYPPERESRLTTDNG
jgi:hypothetical protein